MSKLPLEVAELQSADYGSATEPCDLVMKGGVTSGVVYPTAICRLARTFRLKSIGGTSAGALAAALAAAAEYDRSRDGRSSRGFQRLAGVSDYLGTGDNLRNLFQPSRRTAALFGIGMAWIEHPSPWSLIAALARAYLIWIGFAAVLGTIVGGIAVALLHNAPAAALGGLLDFCVTLVVVIGWRLYVALASTIPDNDFGLCTGVEKPNPFAPRPLTRWLADRIDFVAGRTPDRGQSDDSALAPLTFGDLYGEPNGPNPFPGGSAVLDTLNAVSQRVINLEMVTTDVTAGRPYRLPFDDDDVMKFFYCRTELSRFFPPRVLDRMQGREITISVRDPANSKKPKSVNVMPFPSAADLPVIVAARMSMSFPILFSAIPLYAVYRKAFNNWTPGTGQEPEFCKTWFSDGGLSSNIPIHFFDGPIPRRPTFALNLRGTPRTIDGLDAGFPNPATDEQKVFRATCYDPDVEQFDLHGTKRLFQFANSLLDAMRNWNDNTLMQLPGYRERTVEIAMSDEEGGLNLTMPPEMVQSIVTRGAYAGACFATTFGPQLAYSQAWNDHRHLRLRASLLMQSEWSRRYALAWNTPVPTPAPTFAQLITGTSPSYSRPFDSSEYASAAGFAGGLAGISGTIATGITLTKEPVPSTELRARPRF